MSAPILKQIEKLKTENDRLRKLVDEKVAAQVQKVQLNVRGEMIKTELTTLTKVKGSTLAAMFSKKIQHEKDKAGSIRLDEDPVAFKHMVKYLESNRNELPSPDDPIRSATEEMIRDFGVDKGLARPDTLTTKVGQEFQKILYTAPEFGKIKNKKALDKWRALQPINLSELSLMSGIAIDLDDETMEIAFTDNESKVEQLIRCKDGGTQDMFIARCIFKDKCQL